MTFNGGSRCDVDAIGCSCRQSFPADASITLLGYLLDISFHPRPVNTPFHQA